MQIQLPLATKVRDECLSQINAVNHINTEDNAVSPGQRPTCILQKSPRSIFVIVSVTIRNVFTES